MGNHAIAKPRWTTGAILWLVVMFIMASFQTWRGAIVDGVLFYTVVVLLLTDRIVGERWVALRRLRTLPRWAVWSGGGLAAVVLTVAPRHGTIVFVVMVAIGIGMLALAWGGRSRLAHLDSVALRRSARTWGALGVGLCLWEAIAFVLSVTLPGGVEAYPTVSVLLDPVLQNILGQGLFVALWLLAGVGLITIWRRS